MQDIARRSIHEYLARRDRALERRELLQEAIDENRELLDRLRES